MKSKYPIKKISTVNLLSIIAVIGFQFLISNAQHAEGDGGFQLEFRNSIIGLIIMSMIAISNLMILLLFEKSSALRFNQYERIYFFSASYIINISIFVLVIIFHGKIFYQILDFSGFYYLIIIGAFANTLSLVIQNYVILQNSKLNAEMENSLLKAANAEAANLLLRQQIHPHFLFNSLNVLKSLYKKNPETAERYLVCLSNFLRVAISNNNIKIIRLDDEIKLCLDYLELQKIRFGDALVCTIDISEDRLENGFVPSFSVQPLIV